LSLRFGALTLLLFAFALAEAGAAHSDGANVERLGSLAAGTDLELDLLAVVE
jgi:hypothetical protein